MTDHLDLSVIVPYHDDAESVARAVKSALDRDVSMEVVVIDDASGSPLDRELLPPGPVRVIRLDRNGGTGHARNVGILSAGGEWIAFLDADDEWSTGRASAIVEATRTSTADGLVTSTRLMVDDVDVDLIQPRASNGRVPLQSPVIACALVIRHQHFAVQGLFDLRWRMFEDYDFWLRLHRLGATIELIDAPPYVYRRSTASKTGGASPALAEREFRRIAGHHAFARGFTARDRLSVVHAWVRWGRMQARSTIRGLRSRRR